MTRNKIMTIMAHPTETKIIHQVSLGQSEEMNKIPIDPSCELVDPCSFEHPFFPQSELYSIISI